MAFAGGILGNAYNALNGATNGIKSTPVQPGVGFGVGTGTGSASPGLPGTPGLPALKPFAPTPGQIGASTNPPAASGTFKAAPAPKPATAPAPGANTPPANTPPASSPPPDSSSNGTPPPTSYISPHQAQVDALTKQLAASQTPTDEEKTLQQQIDDLEGSTKTGVVGLEGRVPGEQLSLVRGEQAKLQQQGDLQVQTLQQKLANMIANRTASQEAIKTELANAQSGLTADTTKTNPTTVGNSILQYDPTTGTYKTLYTASDTQADKPVTLSAGQSVIDPKTGKVIYSAPAEAADKTYTLSPGQVVVDAKGNRIAEGEAQKGSGSDIGSLTTSQRLSLNSQISSNEDVKAYLNATSASSRATQINNELNSGKIAKDTADNAIIDLYAKSINPGAIVRDPTVLRIVGSQSALSQLLSAFNSAATGGAKISDQQRNEMVQIINSQVGSAGQNYVDVANRYKQQFNLSDDDINAIFPDYAKLSSGNTDASVQKGDPAVQKQVEANLRSKMKTNSQGTPLSDDDYATLSSEAASMKAQGIPDDQIAAAINKALGY